MAGEDLLSYEDLIIYKSNIITPQSLVGAIHELPLPTDELHIMLN